MAKNLMAYAVLIGLLIGLAMGYWSLRTDYKHCLVEKENLEKRVEVLEKQISAEEM